MPRNPLDVLAQQIVAMVATGDEWTRARAARAGAARLPVRRPVARAARPGARHARRPLPVRGVRRAAPADRLGPRRDVIRARKGARQLAVTNAGTIPDRGLFGVHLPDGRRVGELDEEMVYEARPGQVVHARRVDLADRGDHPRPRDRHARARLARARSRSGAATRVGRPVELGKAIGEFSRWAVDREPGELIEAGYDLDERAANNLIAYLREQRDATRVVPSDRTIVIERFRDEIGDWRLCVLTPVRRPRARRLGRWR